MTTRHLFKKREIKPEPDSKPGRVATENTVVRPNSGQPDPQNGFNPPIGKAKMLRTSQVTLKTMIGMVVKHNIINMALVVLTTAVAVLFVIGASQENLGNFTISLDKRDMYKYGIALSETRDFAETSSRLQAVAIANATNISINDLPGGLTDSDGSHNGANYIAYTFYLKNAGERTIDYQYRIEVQEVTRRVDTAVRFAMYYNGQERTVYAKNGANGSPEPGTIPFATDTVVDAGLIRDMAVGAVDKYTVVIWLEGDDPECLDDLLGGLIKMGMKIDVLEPEQGKPADKKEV